MSFNAIYSMIVTDLPSSRTKLSRSSSASNSNRPCASSHREQLSRAVCTDSHLDFSSF